MEPVIPFDDENHEPFKLCEIIPKPSGSGFFVPRPYQNDAVDAFYRDVNRHISAMIVAATGLGKTIMFAETALRWPDDLGRVLILVHREELADQAAEKIGVHIDENIAIEMGERRESQGRLLEDNKPKVLVGSVQSLSRPKRREKFNPSEFGLVVIDECVPAGTLIDGRPVEEFRVGDSIMAFNHDRNQPVMSTVSRLFRRKTRAVCRIVLEDGRRLICTPNEPLFTPDGYVSASELMPGDITLTIQDESNGSGGMQDMRIFEGEGGQASYQERLVHLLPGLSVESEFADNGIDKQSSCIRSHEDSKPNEASRNQRKGIAVSSGNWVVSESSRGQWPHYCSAGVTGGSIGVAYGSGRENSANARRVSESLQDRHCQCRSNDSSGGRRKYAQGFSNQGSGQTQRSFLGGTRVDSVAVLEQGCDGEFERVCPGGVVYNLEVEKHHNYFLNGILAHNCHHGPSASYRTVLKYFLQNPQLRILGVTATPNRHDEKAMGDIFQSVSYEMSIVDGINEGWLVDIENKQVVVEGLDFSKCRSTAGDLNEKDLANVMMGGVGDRVVSETGVLTELQREQVEQQEKMLHAVAVPTIREAQGRPTLVFCVTKVHAERMCEVFNRYPGIHAEFVTDETSKEDRKNITRDFKAGRFQILVGVGVHTEGFDARVDVVVIARRTKSKSLLTQMIGRGTRPLPNTVDNYSSAEDRKEAIANSAKPLMTVLDFIGTTGSHNLAEVTDILGGEYEEDIIAAAKAKLRNGETEVVSELLKKTKEEFEAEKKRRQIEKEERDRLAQIAAEEEKERRRLEAIQREKIRAEVQYRTETVSIKGAVVPEQVGVDVFRGGATDNQVKYLIRLGIQHDAACKFTKSQAGAVIDKLQSQEGGKFIMRFGKYCGVEIGKLPSHYVEWAEKNMNDPALIQNINLMRHEQRTTGQLNK